MDTLVEVDDRDDVLRSWVGGRGQRPPRGAAPPTAVGLGLRFAFYGRTSTEGFQDPVSSQAWQREVAESVIAGRGEIVEDFVDVGWSREVAWERRPRAAALLAAARSPGRRFDAVVVGEYERGFTARQFLRVAEQLERHGVRVWLPEADGPVDPADPTHRALVTALGAIAQREVSRARHRTLAAMRAQAFRAGPLPGRAPAVRVPAGGRRAASEPCAGRVGQALAAVGPGAGHRGACAVDVRPPAGGAQPGGHRPRVERA